MANHEPGPSSPNVSTDFHQTLLVLLPCALFWLLLPGLAFQCSRHRFRPLPWTFLSYLKVIVPTVPVIASLFTFSRALKSAATLMTVNCVLPIVQILTLVGLILAYIHSHRSGLVSSGIIFNSWLTFTVAGIPKLYHILYNEDHTHDISFAYFIWFVGCATTTLLHTFADARNPGEEPNAELDSSFLNRLVLHWYSRLPITGSKKDLVVDDLFDINNNHRADNLETLWDYYWQPTIQKYKNKCRTRISVETEVPLPSIVFNLFKMFKFEVILAMLVKVCSDVLQFGNPYLLKQLIEYVSDPNADLDQGILLGILMFGVSQLRSLLNNYYFFLMFRVGT